MIKLTATDAKEKYIWQRDLWLNPVHIVSIQNCDPNEGDGRGMQTHIGITGSDNKGWYVSESPRQILDLIDEDNKHL